MSVSISPRAILPRAILTGFVLAFVALSACAQDKPQDTTAEDVRAEVSEAMEAIGNYSAQQRDEALREAREALKQLDSEIERREQAAREEWADMSKLAREQAQAGLRDLREARNTLGERYGALQSGTSSAWTELREGFSDAWDAFQQAWNAADEKREST